MNTSSEVTEYLRESPDGHSPDALAKTIAHMLSLQHTDGYWWFALEANESIGAEFIFLMNYLGAVDEAIQKGIAQRILDVQRPDGTWAMYNDGPACLSTTVECYFALKIAGFGLDHPAMAKAREYILKSGGIENTRVFTKIHLAMFGIVPWGAAPAMPAEFILLPNWFPFNIYEFSSWARATVVPLLIFMSARKVRALSVGLNELFCNPSDKRNYSFKTSKGLLSWESFFIHLDKLLKFLEKSPFKPFRKYSIRKCSEWTWNHVSKTEDIYPALAYGALAFKALGYANDSPEIRKPFEAIKMFQRIYATPDVPPLPDSVYVDHRTIEPSNHRTVKIHQQCCISPVWDTPWMLTALIEAGVPADHPALVRAGRWLISKQITDFKGDWAVKNPNGIPGGWAFEFENSHFPDVDDTIQVLTALHKMDIPLREKEKPCLLGLNWLLSMQSSDGGWGAFDKNQTQGLVNRIPFSDHGACLDPSSPDITGRMIEFLASQRFTIENPVIDRALKYLWKIQENFGGWFARWGINYIYGTWCALTGLRAIGWDMSDPRITKAVRWLESIQHSDGGFGESPESYLQKKFVDWKRSVPSQTAWALMGLVAGGGISSESARSAADFLLKNRNENGSWNEADHTGTGFPGHFYIRYHGYRHFFPLLALARWNSLRKMEQEETAEDILDLRTLKSTERDAVSLDEYTKRGK